MSEMGGAMHTGRLAVPPAQLGVAAEEAWFAIQTRPRHEKKVASDLEGKGVTVFLPLFTAVHQWSDRKRRVQVPLFTNYVFVRLAEQKNARAAVLRTNGVLSFVGIRGSGICIPDEQIEAIQVILREKVPFAPCPFVDVGQRVRIRGGSLDGISGILVKINDDRSLVISVDSIQRSLAIRIAGYNVSPA